jgi:acylphosphatase
MALARVHLLVSGRVQGVWYRQATCDEARALGLRGWVRNVPDGRVEVEAEGEREALGRLLAFCRRGPPRADVDDVEVVWTEHRGDLGPFSVQR